MNTESCKKNTRYVEISFTINQETSFFRDEALVAVIPLHRQPTCCLTEMEEHKTSHSRSSPRQIFFHKMYVLLKPPNTHVHVHRTLSWPK